MGNPYLAIEQNWNGFYVIKPTLLPDWKGTIKFASENPNKTVFSTVFESPFGYEALIRASSFSNLEGISRTCFSQIPTELDCHHQASFKDTICNAISNLLSFGQNLIDMKFPNGSFWELSKDSTDLNALSYAKNVFEILNQGESVEMNPDSAASIELQGSNNALLLKLVAPVVYPKVVSIHGRP